jgi:hypothetical protein
MFDLQEADPDPNAEAEAYEEADSILPSLEFKGHNGPYHPPAYFSEVYATFPHQDAVGSVAFHPLQPMLLSASGSRHFHPDDELSELSSSSDDTDDDESAETSQTERSNVTRPKIRSHPITLDSSIKMWNFDAARLLSAPIDPQINPSS